MNGVPSGAGAGGLALLMLATGLGIPVLAAWNADLGQRLASPAAATVALFGVGLLASATVLAIVGPPDVARFRGTPPHLYFAALFMLFYILSISWTAPRIGLGNAIFFVLLGQLAAAAAIDHFGLFGAVRSAITPRRAAGIAVMIAGVYLARKPR